MIEEIEEIIFTIGEQCYAKGWNDCHYDASPKALKDMMKKGWMESDYRVQLIELLEKNRG